MDFGMIPYDDFKEEQFLLPDIEQHFLSGSKNKFPKFYLGLSKWTYREKEKQKSSPHPQPGTLPFYANYFNAVELNNSHYVLPTRESMEKWYSSVKETDFKFCPKLHKAISHEGKIGLHKIGASKEFIDRVGLLKEKLGTSFLQLNYHFKSEDETQLFEYLKALPIEFNLSIELRNKEWLSNADKFNEFVIKLNKLNKGTVIFDTPGIREACHMKLSNSIAFIRFDCIGTSHLDIFRIEFHLLT